MTSLEALSVRMGALSWISAELFTLEGRWSSQMAAPAAVTHLATHSRHHGWHASLWQQALPDSPALDARSTIVAPPGWQTALDTAHTFDGDDASDAARLAVLYRGLVPRLSNALMELSERLGGPGDAAIERTLGMVLADVTSDLLGGLGALSATLGDDEAIDAAAAATKNLDQSFRT